MSNVMETLYGDHEAFVQLVDLIEQEIETFRQAEDRPDYTLLEAVIEYFKAYPDCVHHPAEDLIYEKLKLRAPDHCAQIPDLQREHRRESECLRAFAELLELVLAEEEIAREKVIEAAETFTHQIRRHMEMEEAKFFPVAKEHLHTEDWIEIDSRLREQQDELYGGRRPPHFEDLREDLLRWRASRD